VTKIYGAGFVRGTSHAHEGIDENLEYAAADPHQEGSQDEKISSESRCTGEQAQDLQTRSSGQERRIPSLSAKGPVTKRERLNPQKMEERRKPLSVSESEKVSRRDVMHVGEILTVTAMAVIAR